MATEPTGESAAGEDKQRSVPTPFLIKTYQLVDDPSVDDLISWNEYESGFIIWLPVEFAKDLLPKYFKHSNLSSFVQKLNSYVRESKLGFNFNFVCPRCFGGLDFMICNV